MVDFRGLDLVANVGVNLDPDLEAAAAPLKMNAALYIGGMGSREKNFYNQLAVRMGFEEAAKQIQDLYLGRDYDGAFMAQSCMSKVGPSPAGLSSRFT